MGARLTDDDINTRVKRRAMQLREQGRDQVDGPAQLRALQSLAEPARPIELCRRLSVTPYEVVQILAGLCARDRIELDGGVWRIKLLQPTRMRAP